MEFHPYLGALATRLCDVINFVTHDAAAAEKDEEGSSVKVECEVLRMALVEWGDVNNFGATLHPDLDRDVSRCHRFYQFSVHARLLSTNLDWEP